MHALLSGWRETLGKSWNEQRCICKADFNSSWHRSGKNPPITLRSRKVILETQTKRELSGKPTSYINKSNLSFQQETQILLWNQKKAWTKTGWYLPKDKTLDSVCPTGIKIKMGKGRLRTVLLTDKSHSQTRAAQIIMLLAIVPCRVPKTYVLVFIQSYQKNV